MGKMIEATNDIPGTSSHGKGGFGSTGVYAIKPTKKKITEFEDGKGPEDKFAYKIGSHLTPRETSRINTLMHQYEDILAVSYEDIQGQGSISQHQHDIDIGDSKPIKQRLYPLPFHMKAWVEREISEMMKAGMIVPSKSPWSSPIVIAAKKAANGKTAPRFCVNYKKVNDATVKDAHPIPRIQDILAHMCQQPRFFTNLDLFSGFNQIGLTERAQLISAFVTPLGQYHYL